MKLVSLLCLILGTACVAEIDRSIVDPNAPDLAALDPQPTEADGSDLDQIPRERFDPTTGRLPQLPRVTPNERVDSGACTRSLDCAADEICDAGTCAPIQPCATDDMCGPGGVCVAHVCASL
jgi:hypothetical protein